MSIITLPTLVVPKLTWGQQRYDLDFSNGDTGSSQTRVLAPPRWLASLMSNEGLSVTEAAEWRALILSLRGRVNQLAVHDYGNPAPQGTMRGTLTANTAAVAGATSMSVTGGVGQASTTLKKGDWLGVNQSAGTRQLLHIAADATANGSGVISITFEPPLRVDVAAASSVVWDKPTALFRQRTPNTSWAYEGASRGAYSLDMIESWEG